MTMTTSWRTTHRVPYQGLIRAIFLVIITNAAGSRLAHADVRTFVSIRDTTLYEDAAGMLGNGGGTAMFAGTNSQSLSRRALVKFDIAAGIPAGSTIDYVTLRLHNDAANTSPAPVTMHRLLQEWGEGASVALGNQGGGAAALIGDATWLHRYYPDEFWTTVGGDYVAFASASAVVAGPGLYEWSSQGSLVSDVQGFLDNPQSNFGWLLLGNELEASTSKRFATREATDALLRPALTVEYTPVPQPSAAALMLFSIVFVIRRRRTSCCWHRA